MNPLIVEPSQEFLVVNQSQLSQGDCNFNRTLEDNKKLEDHLNGKTVITCFEGDLVQVCDNNAIVFSHQDIFKLPKEKFKDLKERKKATCLDETLDRFQRFKDENSGEKVVLCIELKSITDVMTVYHTIEKLIKRGITDAYFDSFYGNRLDNVFYANSAYGSSYPRSYHTLAGHIGKLKITVPFIAPEKGFDLISTQRPVSFGNLDFPVIYGAIGSVDQLQRISHEDKVIGAYVRVTEGRGMVRMLMNGSRN